MMKFTICLTLVLVYGAPSFGGEPLVWPQFRGPGGSGIAEEQKPPVEVGPDKNVKWKISVPGGTSSPIVVGDLLVFTCFDDGKLITMAINRADIVKAQFLEQRSAHCHPARELVGLAGRDMERLGQSARNPLGKVAQFEKRPRGYEHVLPDTGREPGNAPAAFPGLRHRLRPQTRSAHPSNPPRSRAGAGYRDSVCSR